MTTATLHHVKIPLRRPFGHVLATRDHAEAIVLVLTDGERIGVGECVPRDYVTGEDFDTVWQAVRAVDLGAMWRLVDTQDRRSLVASVERLDLPRRLATTVPGLAAGCAVELALLDLACKQRGWELGELAGAMDLADGLLGADPEPISIPLDFHREPADLAHLVGSKLANLKIKVGRDLATDVRRIRECRDLFGPELSISIDANMAWTFSAALAAADAFHPFTIGWYEEPLQPTERTHYRALRERAGIAIMLDEAACSFAQTKAAIEAGWCDLINIRLSKCGGFLASLRLAALARAAGVRFQHGTQVGQLGFLNAAGRHFTRSVRGIVACEGGPGLANLSDFPSTVPLSLDWSVGHLVGLAGPGIGANPDLAKLATYAVRSAVWNGTRWSA